MHAKPDEVFRELEAMAERLTARKCWYMAGVLMQYYDGEFADETKAARLQAARRYFDIARQRDIERETQAATPK
jgi:hypothetical protein